LIKGEFYLPPFIKGEFFPACPRPLQLKPRDAWRVALRTSTRLPALEAQLIAGKRWAGPPFNKGRLGGILKGIIMFKHDRNLFSYLVGN
jgi:hypothetical protein